MDVNVKMNIAVHSPYCVCICSDTTVGNYWNRSNTLGKETISYFRLGRGVPLYGIGKTMLRYSSQNWMWSGAVCVMESSLIGICLSSFLTCAHLRGEFGREAASEMTIAGPKV